jgi:hypothetical protein
MSDKHNISIMCGYCGKRIRVDVSFVDLVDITHIVELTAELEKRGWAYQVHTGNGRSIIRLNTLCEVCQVGRV